MDISWESESSRHLHQWRLDAVTIPNYVIKKGRLRGARHGKTEAQKEKEKEKEKEEREKQITVTAGPFWWINFELQLQSDPLQELEM